MRHGWPADVRAVFPILFVVSEAHGVRGHGRPLGFRRRPRMRSCVLMRRSENRSVSRNRPFRFRFVLLDASPAPFSGSLPA
eukprot:8235648-Pyramimonas_sp.AAC.1